MRIYLDYHKNHTYRSPGWHLERALIELGHTIDPVDYDLRIAFDDAHTEPETRPVFRWMTDSNRLKNSLDLGHYNKLFINSKDFDAYPKAIFLPVGADPNLYRRTQEPEYDVCHTGRIGDVLPYEGYKHREVLINKLRDSKFSVNQENEVYGDDYARSLSKGKLILNRPGLQDLNMRFFEAMCVGCMLWYPIGDYTEIATPFYHYVPFTNDDEFFEMVEKYTKDDIARKQIEKNARELILAKHTYKHRALEMLSYV